MVTLGSNCWFLELALLVLVSSCVSSPATMPETQEGSAAPTSARILEPQHFLIPFVEVEDPHLRSSQVVRLSGEFDRSTNVVKVVGEKRYFNALKELQFEIGPDGASDLWVSGQIYPSPDFIGLNEWDQGRNVWGLSGFAYLADSESGLLVHVCLDGIPSKYSTITSYFVVDYVIPLADILEPGKGLVSIAVSTVPHDHAGLKWVAPSGQLCKWIGPVNAHNLRDLAWKLIPEHGTLRCEASYQNGRLDGTLEVFSPLGFLRELRTYEGGQPSGLAVRFWPSPIDKALKIREIVNAPLDGSTLESYKCKGGFLEGL